MCYIVLSALAKFLFPFCLQFYGNKRALKEYDPLAYPKRYYVTQRQVCIPIGTSQCLCMPNCSCTWVILFCVFLSNQLCQARGFDRTCAVRGKNTTFIIFLAGHSGKVWVIPCSRITGNHLASMFREKNLLSLALRATSNKP